MYVQKNQTKLNNRQTWKIFVSNVRKEINIFNIQRDHIHGETTGYIR